MGQKSPTEDKTPEVSKENVKLLNISGVQEAQPSCVDGMKGWIKLET